MQCSEHLFARCSVDSVRTEKLSDQSIVLCDLASKRVHSLTPTAAAVWEACADTASHSTILSAVQAKLGPSIDEEAVLTALESLQEANLIYVQEAETVPAPVIGLSRRRLVASLGSLAIPAVVTLTLAEQRAYAGNYKSDDDDHKSGDDDDHKSGDDDDHK